MAFPWNAPTEANFDVYVLLLSTGTPVRLTTDAAADRSSLPAAAPGKVV